MHIDCPSGRPEAPGVGQGAPEAGEGAALSKLGGSDAQRGPSDRPEATGVGQGAPEAG